MTTPSIITGAEKFLGAIGALFLFILTGLFVVPFSTLIGAICGWSVGLVFGGIILDVFDKLGLHDVTMWQMGAFLGFSGGFLKTKVSGTKEGPP